LHAVWDEIYLKSPTDAVQYLASKETAARRTVSAFGISVDERLIMLLGPGMIFFVALYLLALLRNLADTMTRYPTMATSVSWIGAYDEPSARLVAILSCSILPIGASVIVVTRGAHSIDWRVAIGLAAAVGVGVVSVLSLATMRKIRELRAAPVPIRFRRSNRTQPIKPM
jgi:hypothetical protein